MLLLNMWTLLSLYYHVGFPCSVSEPHGGRFDADDAERRPVDGRAATWNPTALKKLLVLYARRTGGRPINKTQKAKTLECRPQSFWAECWPWGVGRRGSGSCGRWSRSSGCPASSWTCPDCWRGSGNTCVCVCLCWTCGCFSFRVDMCVCLCICVACVATCVPSSSPRLVNRYSYPYAALQLSHTTW